MGGGRPLNVDFRDLNRRNGRHLSFFFTFFLLPIHMQAGPWTYLCFVLEKETCLWHSLLRLLVVFCSLHMRRNRFLFLIFLKSSSLLVATELVVTIKRITRRGQESLEHFIEMIARENLKTIPKNRLTHGWNSYVWTSFGCGRSAELRSRSENYAIL